MGLWRTKDSCLMYDTIIVAKGNMRLQCIQMILCSLRSSLPVLPLLEKLLLWYLANEIANSLLTGIGTGGPNHGRHMATCVWIEPSNMLADNICNVLASSRSDTVVVRLGDHVRPKELVPESGRAPVHRGHGIFQHLYISTNSFTPRF